MASRILARLGAGVARSAARGRRLPAGHIREPALAGARGGPATISPALQIRFASDGTKPTRRLTKTEKNLDELAARIQALERAGAMSEKLMELAERRAAAAERRAEAAERRAAAAERRAEVVEGRMERLEHNLVVSQTRMDSHVLLTSAQFAYLLQLHGHVDQHLRLNFAVNAHSYWTISKEIDELRIRMSAMKAEYMNEVLAAKTAVSASSWSVVMVLLSAFGAITIYYLPYVVNNVKAEILKEVVQMVKDMLQPLIDQVSEVKQEQANKKGRWF